MRKSTPHYGMNKLTTLYKDVIMTHKLSQILANEMAKVYVNEETGSEGNEFDYMTNMLDLQTASVAMEQLMMAQSALIESEATFRNAVATGGTLTPEHCALYEQSVVNAMMFLPIPRETISMEGMVENSINAIKRFLEFIYDAVKRVIKWISDKIKGIVRWLKGRGKDKGNVVAEEAEQTVREAVVAAAETHAKETNTPPDEIHTATRPKASNKEATVEDIVKETVKPEHVEAVKEKVKRATHQWTEPNVNTSIAFGETINNLQVLYSLHVSKWIDGQNDAVNAMYDAAMHDIQGSNIGEHYVKFAFASLPKKQSRGNDSEYDVLEFLTDDGRKGSKWAKTYRELVSDVKSLDDIITPEMIFKGGHTITNGRLPDNDFVLFATPPICPACFSITANIKGDTINELIDKSSLYVQLTNIPNFNAHQAALTTTRTGTYDEYLESKRRIAEKVTKLSVSAQQSIADNVEEYVDLLDKRVKMFNTAANKRLAELNDAIQRSGAKDTNVAVLDYVVGLKENNRDAYIEITESVKKLTHVNLHAKRTDKLVKFTADSFKAIQYLDTLIGWINGLDKGATVLSN